MIPSHSSIVNRRSLGVPVDPVEYGLVPELTVLRLQDPMAFVGKIEELGRNSYPLQSGEQLHALCHRHPEVLFSMDDEHRRLEVLDEARRRPARVQLGARPWSPAKFPLGKPQLFGGTVHADRKSTRLNSSHEWISYAVFCSKKKRRT